MIEKVVIETTVLNTNYSSKHMTYFFGLHQYLIFKIFLSRYQDGGRSAVGGRETCTLLYLGMAHFPNIEI